MKVTLLQSMGDDLSIVNAARVSFAKESKHNSDGILTDADAGLINYLMKHKHGTPFEMVQFKFHVEVPICVAREWQRHRIGSFNEVSTRYVEMEQNFYVPQLEHVRVQVGKPGHYKFEAMEPGLAEKTVDIMAASYEASYKAYQQLLELGVAKELAREVLPLGLYTQFIWSVNLRSLFNFLMLRTAENALLEIRLPAKQVERWVTQVVPEAMKAWNEHGRVCP